MLPLFFSKLLFSLIVIFSTEGAFSKDVPGLLESLEFLIDDQREKIKLHQRETLAQGPMGNFNNVEEVYIDGLFLKSIILHSEDGFLSLAKDDRCLFYSLLENGLLRGSDGPIEGLVVNVKLKGSDDYRTRYVSKKALLEYVHGDKCFTNKEIITLFIPANVKKTLDTLEYPTPSNLEECDRILGEWKENRYTPYLCGFSRKVDQGVERYKGRADFFRENYLRSLCKGIADSESFCREYTTRDIWTNIIGRGAPQYKMSFKCRNYLGKKSVTAQDLVQCSHKFKSNPEVCTTLETGLSSLFPYPDCRQISSALSLSRLKTDYHDCPGLIEHTGIINAHRIIRHFESGPLPVGFHECFFNPHASFVDLNTKFKHPKGWDMEICYKERIAGKDVCSLYIPGRNDDNPLSENNVIAKALRYLVGMSQREVCEFSDKDTYNPLLLEYKTGCYIVFDEDNCTALNCPKKIIYDNREVKDLEFRGRPIFSYFPDSFGNASFSLSAIVENIYNQTPRAVRHFTELKFFLGRENTIIHGIGCIGDILPEFFRKKALNECNPVPFIIDGYRQTETEFFVAVRTAIDDVHSPRLVKWDHLFNAVSTYQSIHPLKSWAMNVLR